MKVTTWEENVIWKKGNSQYPYNRDQAIAQGFAKWKDGNGCPICRTPETARYVDGDECCSCLSKRLNAELDPNEPRSRNQAIDQGKDYFYKKSYILCKHGPHLPKHRLHAKPGKPICINCEVAAPETPEAILMRVTPEAVIPRRTARTMGLKVYRTGKPCRRGHSGFRYVSSQGCINCKNGD